MNLTKNFILALYPDVIFKLKNWVFDFLRELLQKCLAFYGHVGFRDREFVIYAIMQYALSRALKICTILYEFRVILLICKHVLRFICYFTYIR